MTPQSAIVSATRSIICLTECSRCGVPMWPRKYFDAVTFVARADQAFGNSRFFCSKTTLPCSLVIVASLVSHSTVSYGWTPGRVKRRSMLRPFQVFVAPSVSWR